MRRLTEDEEKSIRLFYTDEPHVVKLLSEIDRLRLLINKNKEKEDTHE